MIPALRGVVEDLWVRRSLGGLDDRLEAGRGGGLLSQQGVEVLHIGGMVLAVVKLNGLRRYDRRERVVGVSKLRQSEHDRALSPNA